MNIDFDFDGDIKPDISTFEESSAASKKGKGKSSKEKKGKNKFDQEKGTKVHRHLLLLIRYLLEVHLPMLYSLAVPASWPLRPR
jgi:hypothetical protein